MHGSEMLLLRTFHNLKNDANVGIHSFLLTLERRLLQEGRLPDTIFVRIDGGSENANKYLLAICELLAARRLTKNIVLSRLPVGHTHEDIDGKFGCLWRGFRNNFTVTPGWLPGGLSGWLPGGLPGWLPGCLPGGLTGWLPGCLPCCLPGGSPEGSPPSRSTPLPGWLPGCLPGAWTTWPGGSFAATRLVLGGILPSGLKMLFSKIFQMNTWMMLIPASLERFLLGVT